MLGSNAASTAATSPWPNRPYTCWTTSTLPIVPTLLMSVSSFRRLPRRSAAGSSPRVPAGREPFLDDLALAAGGLAEAARRHPGRAVERADEVRQVGEPGVERDVGDRGGPLGEPARGGAQARRDHV